MFDWFQKLPDPAKAIVVGALLGSSIAAIIALITIGTKDYLFPLLTERRTARSTRKLTFRKYANPLILSSISLLYRIKEIFYRGYFLLDSTPKNIYNEYKYISSIYRLCALIGWIRASRIELSHIEVSSSREYQTIEKAISEFEKSLADGEHIEQSVLEQLAKIWAIDISRIALEAKNKLGVRIERIIDVNCFKESVEIPTSMSSEKKLPLAKEVCDLICESIGSSKIKQEIVNESLETSIREMSRTETWIYRDWQSAIGDFMIKKTSDTDRKFDVIGYKEFESLYFSTEAENKKWINRIDRLFKNLDVSVDDRFDARTQQFRNVYNSTYNLLSAFSRIKTSDVDIAKDELKKLPSLL